MTEATQGYRPLDEIISESCFADGDYDRGTYDPRYALGVRWLRGYAGPKLRIGTNIRRRRIDVTTDTNRIPWPKDMQANGHISIGFPYNGNVMVFAYNPAMDTTLVDDCGAVQPVEGGNTKGVTEAEATGYGAGYVPAPGACRSFAAWDWYGVGGSPLIGWGGGHVAEGDYQMDYERREYVFSSSMKDRFVILEYVCDPFNPNAENIIPTICTEACLLFIEWHYLKHLAKKGNNTIFWGMSKDAASSFSFSMINTKRLLSEMTPDETRQSLRRSAGGAINS